jgi:hypothetical protein
MIALPSSIHTGHIHSRERKDSDTQFLEICIGRGTLSLECERKKWKMNRLGASGDLLYGFRYYLTSGTKFGADFLAYEQDPELCHSTFAVKIVPGGRLDDFELGATCRAATGARKRLLIANPDIDNDRWVVQYTTVAFEKTIFPPPG